MQNSTPKSQIALENVLVLRSQTSNKPLGIVLAEKNFTRFTWHRFDLYKYNETTSQATACAELCNAIEELMALRVKPTRRGRQSAIDPVKLAQLVQQNVGVREIARQLNYSRSAVSRFLKKMRESAGVKKMRKNQGSRH